MENTEPMGFYEDRILPRCIDIALGKQVEPIRARVAAGLRGEVLEVGFGSGRNVRHYPDAVTRVYAVEPSSGGRDLAEPRIAESRVPVELIGLDGQDLPLADSSVDHVLITWTLCTIPDVGQALREVVRVLRPGGELHFVEHGRAPSPKVAAWQDRLTPLWGKVAGGCHLNRPIDELVTDAGLEITHLENFSMGGPDVFGWAYEGVATRSVPA